MGLHMLIKLKPETIQEFTAIIDGDLHMQRPEDNFELPCQRETLKTFILEHFLSKTLNIDKDHSSYTWLISLIQISLGFETGFDLATEEILQGSNNAYRTPLYKAFINPKDSYIKPIIKIL